jgi:hypothetical protein
LFIIFTAFSRCSLMFLSVLRWPSIENHHFLLLSPETCGEISPNIIGNANSDRIPNSILLQSLKLYLVAESVMSLQ